MYLCTLVLKKTSTESVVLSFTDSASGTSHTTIKFVWNTVQTKIRRIMMHKIKHSKGHQRADFINKFSISITGESKIKYSY